MNEPKRYDICNPCHHESSDGNWVALDDPAYQEMQEHALRYQLDQVGIEQRESERAELVELRAKLADSKADADRWVSRFLGAIKSQGQLREEKDREIKQLKAEVESAKIEMKERLADAFESGQNAGLSECNPWKECGE